jgi:hypothetical protein
MADARIICGAGDKLLQLECVAKHSQTTDLDSRVSIAVVSRVNKVTGKAIVGQSWIASMVGCSERAVRTCFVRMQRLGLWSVKAGGGRNLANTYVPLATKRGMPVPGFDQKGGMEVPGLNGKTRKTATRNPENRDTKPGTQVPILPSKNYQEGSPSSGDAVHYGEVLPPEREIEFDDFYNALQDNPGKKGPAISAWRKLTEDDRRAIAGLIGPHGINLDGMYASVWLANRRWLVPQPEPKNRAEAIPKRRTVTLDPYSPQWQAEFKRREKAGLPTAFMRNRAESGHGWDIEPSGDPS